MGSDVQVDGSLEAPEQTSHRKTVLPASYREQLTIHAQRDARGEPSRTDPATRAPGAGPN